MRKNKLFLILGKLSKEELKSFGSWLYTANSKQGVLLKTFNYIKKYYPDFTSAKLHRENLVQQLFDNTDPSSKRILNVFSKLRTRLEDFLLQQYLQKSDKERNVLLAKVYQQYELQSILNTHLKRMEKELSKENKEDNNLSFYKMQISHWSHYNLDNRHLSKVNTHIVEAMQRLDQFYAERKLRYSCELWSRHQILKEPSPQIRGLDLVLNTPDEEKSKLQYAYELIWQLVSTQEEVYFFAIKTLAFEELSRFKKEDAFIFFAYLFNYVAFKIKKGSLEYIRESFEVFQYGIQQELFIIDGYFSENHFINIVDVAAKLREFTWISSFLKRWKSHLKEEVKEHTLTLSKALVGFEEEKYHEVIELMLQLSSPNINFELKARWLRIAAQFELREDLDVLQSQLNAFEHFARRNNLIHETKKSGILHFVKIVRKLLRLNVSKKALQKDLSMATNVYYKSWLKKKIEEL